MPRHSTAQGARPATAVPAAAASFYKLEHSGDPQAVPFTSCEPGFEPVHYPFILPLYHLHLPSAI